MTTSGHSIGVWPTVKHSMDGISDKTIEMAVNGKAEMSLMRLLKLQELPRMRQYQEQHTQSTSSQLEFPASQPPAPGSNEVRQMTAGSGRRLYESYAKSRPLGAFLKILLESETWASTEFYLEWMLKATKSKCLVFQLAPSMPRTVANATGLSESAWPTPMSRDTKGPMHEKDGGAMRRMDYVPNVLKATWPTPDASKAGKTSRSGDRKGEPLIGGIVRSTWPTPRATAGGPEKTKADTKGTTGVSLVTRISGVTTCGCLAQTEKFVVRLMTLSAWLMGYTPAYLAHWATASYRKSRRKS